MVGAREADGQRRYGTACGSKRVFVTRLTRSLPRAGPYLGIREINEMRR
jgi:hypothetical protein